MLVVDIQMQREGGSFYFHCVFVFVHMNAVHSVGVGFPAAAL